jgi:hypothetical protein
MPEISRFFGMVILMYYNDHPPPHFHVRYGDPSVPSSTYAPWPCSRASFHPEPSAS